LDKEMIVQQTKLVRGTVVDKQGEPIIGANISAKGTTNGTITDINGEFSLNVSSNSTLVISYLGYLTQEILVGNNTTFNIALVEDTKTLDEVVVIGYGTSRKKDITGSVSSVKADDLNTIASPNVTQMLQGKVSGLSAVQSSAQPGAGMSITIRGAASPSGSNSPLYVIDGVPLQNNSSGDPGLFGIDYKHGTDRSPLNTINPSDIESIEVLKDASAAAIYGASAANGVVLITTKSGKAGKVKVDYRGAYTHQIRKDYPDVLDAPNFREQVNFWAKEYYMYNNKMGVYGGNAIDLSGYNPIFANVNDYKANTNWIDEVSRQGYIVDQNLSVNGGSERTKYFFSYNFYDNVGMFNQSEMTRHSIRMNLDQEFSKRLKAGIKVNYSNVTNYSTSVGPQGEGDNMLKNAFSYAPDIPVKDENGKYTRSYNQLINNPASFNDVEDKTVTERIFIAPNFELKLIDGLSLRGVGGYDTQSSTRQFYIPVGANQTGAMSNGFANASFAKVINLSGEAYFNYDKVFNDIHRISAVLGAGYYKTQNEGFGAAAFGFFTDAFTYNNLGIASDKEREQLKSWRGERIKLSQFARVNYSLLDKYIITLTARNDGSSYFAKNNKWAFFPSVSAAWRIREEGFMKDFTALSDLKLRAGYGTVGNENVLGVNALSLYQSGYNYLIGSTVHTGLALTQIENPDLKWETNYTINVGIDYGFFNQRMSGSVEYFYRGVRDLLDYQQLPGNNAVGRVAANIGETKSEGFEFSLRSENLTHKDLKWSSILNVSYFKANWVKRNPEVALADYIGEKDELDAIYGWKTDGIITSKEDIPSYMPNANIGNVKYVDHNGDGVLDSKDVVKLGNKTPRWFIGLDNTFSYKGFDLNIYLYSALGYKKTRGQIPDASTLGMHGSAPGNTYTTVSEVWNSQTGTGWIPGIATNPYDSSNPTSTNNFYLMDGSYLKIKNITLGYTLPESVFKKSNFIQNARFFVDTQNIATFTKYHGFDPELYTDNPYPQALSLTFGVNLSF
jgi:TonB-linked SusC/RagA family outer membrane protein